MPELNRIKEIIDIVYPVGSIYISSTVLPIHFKYAGDLFVGEWDLINKVIIDNKIIEYHYKRIK